MKNIKKLMSVGLGVLVIGFQCEASCLEKLQGALENPKGLMEISRREGDAAAYLLFKVEYPQNEVGSEEYAIVRLNSAGICEIVERDVSFVGARTLVMQGGDTGLKKVPMTVLESLILDQVEFEIGSKVRKRKKFLEEIRRGLAKGDSFQDAEWLLSALSKRWGL